MSSIAEHLLHIFNFILENGIWPKAWKTSLVCPIPKNSDALRTSDYRPIGLLPILSKVLEVTLNWQIDENRIIETTELINQDLDAISEWSRGNKIYLNEKKSEAILISKNNSRITKPGILINNKVIPYVDKINNLGLIMNNSLSWDNHISFITSRVYFALRSLKSVNAYLPTDLRRIRRS